jgi:hypothetical protein
MAGNAAVAGFSDRHQSVAQLYCAPLLEAHERVPALRSVEEPAKKQRKRLLAATASSHLWRPAGPWGAPLLSRLSEKAVHPGRDRQGAELRHSREVTQVCSPKVTRRIGEKGPVAGIMHGTRGSARPREAGNLHAFGVGLPSAWMKSLGWFLALGQGLFFGWVTLREQTWVTSRERRGSGRFGGTNTCRFCSLRAAAPGATRGHAL